MTTRTAIDDAVESRQADGLEFLTEFLRIDTENPPGRNYREGAEFLREQLEAREYDVDVIDVPDEVVEEHYPNRTDHDRMNVLARLDEGREGPDVHFTGHYDVVPAGEDWATDPYEPTLEDGNLYARGSSDMKSGIAASVLAVDALRELGVPIEGSITQSMTVDEETGGFTGLGELVREGHISRENTDYCIYTECFDSSRICLGHRGVLKFRVVTHGEKAHGCMAHGGENAVMAMNDFLTRIGEYRETLHGRTTDEPVVPAASARADVSATMIDAGYSENVVPDRCTATFYRVLVPEESVDGAREELEALMAETEAATGARVGYEEIMFAEPALVSRDCTVAQTFAREIEPHHGPPEYVVSPGSDDQRFVVNDAGIEECIVYGPGLLEQAHVEDEYVPVEEVVTAAKVMAAATADLMGHLDG
ncbi:ArgE/DapE family deacylase [Natronosalvus rutilus]|uniref:ArgE/DapE family deacylase n=1 Tax=Natronosalvus rutilus TaxID=2953753 RepID=A0A9E7NA46_9EURY|nr:ArgE/DapE family deacylase [Natronosalvus rutilus]UTF54599.1 ArgE/DapE family deacylase [Natronosalvus rutilus]